MKHLPFDSNYRVDYEVVEERHGNTRLYPHTEQLPVILRAIHLDFYNGLPPRIARVDHRGSGFDKIVLKGSSLLYCNLMNGARSDELRLFSMADRNLVYKPFIAQQITTDTPLGRTHQFRFYGGKELFLDIYLCGKPVVFADHVLQRFSTRTEQPEGEDLSMFLIAFFGSPMLAMPVGRGRAFIVGHRESILAFTYKEEADRYFVTTCLTINEINSLTPELPPHIINQHYDLPFVRPTRRNWLPISTMLDYYQCFEEKRQPVKPERITTGKKRNWHRLAYFTRDHDRSKGHGPGSQLVFIDGLPGPLSMEVLPHQKPADYNEIEAYQQTHPQYDWEAEVAERVSAGTYAPPVYPPSAMTGS